MLHNIIHSTQPYYANNDESDKQSNRVAVHRLISCVSESALQFAQGRQPATEASIDSTRI